MFFIFLGVFLLGISIDLKGLYRRIREESLKGVRKLEEVAESSHGNLLGKIIEHTEILIQKSNIRLYIGYNVWMHFLICMGLAALAFSRAHKYLSVAASLAFTMVMLTIPYVLLQLISDYTGMKEKKNAINFLIILKNFFRAGKNDIFEAFENVARYVSEPLKSYVEVMVFEYKHKINALTCLGNFKQKLYTPELKLYIDNLAISYVQGGDIIALTDTFINELANLDEDDDKQDTEDRILNYGLYILLSLNFIIVYWIIHSSYKKEVLDSLWGQVVFILDMLISIYIIYMTFEKK